jgi:L-rhamnose-H+ transport protein
METPSIGIGITLGILAGVLLGTFALPMKKIKTWQWEHTWVMYSFWGTILLPLILALFTVPNLFAVYTQTPTSILVVVLLFGVGWGVANIAYGIGLKMVGLAIGTAIVLGLNNAIGTILPIIIYKPGQFLQPVGLTITTGVLVMILGIIICAIAGSKRDKILNLPTSESSKATKKSSFGKGLIICLVAGSFGPLFNFALISGKPMEAIAVKLGTNPVNASNPTWIIALSGGFIITLIYCIYLFKTNKNFKLFSASGTGINWIYTLLMGLGWYGGVAIYGMAVTKLGNLGASLGWPIIQSMAVGSGNFWGIVTGEWKGTGKLPLRYMFSGLGLLLVGIIIIGIAASLS